MSNMLQSIFLQVEQIMHISDTCVVMSHDPLINIETIAVSVIAVCCQCDHPLDNTCTEYSKCRYIIRLTTFFNPSLKVRCVNLGSVTIVAVPICRKLCSI